MLFRSECLGIPVTSIFDPSNLPDYALSLIHISEAAASSAAAAGEASAGEAAASSAASSEAASSAFSLQMCIRDSTQTVYQTELDKLRKQIYAVLNKTTTFEEFSALLMQEHGIAVKESRDVYKRQAFPVAAVIGEAFAARRAGEDGGAPGSW